MSRPARLTLASLAGAAIVGLTATLLAVLRPGAVASQASAGLLVAGLVAAGATIANLLLRFVRWHFLLRRLDVRLPTIPSLGAFVGSFSFLPVPLYVGQVVARVRMVRSSARGAGSYVVLAFLWERALDGWALVVLAAPGWARPMRAAALVGAGLFLVPAPRRAVVRALRTAVEGGSRLLVATPIVLDPELVERATGGAALAVSAILSLLAWEVTTVALVPLGWAAGAHTGTLAVQAAAARAILLGGLSLIPLGAGVSGLLLFRRLLALGVPFAAAAPMTFVFRAATVWLSLALGALAFLALARRREHVHDHFDSIDECYDAWLPPHYRQHLVLKKTAPMVAELGLAMHGARGLDIGCGRGWYLNDLRRVGADMVGMDLSARQLVAARDYVGDRVPLVRGAVPGLPFRRASFDFAYIINVLHHEPTPAHQRQALAEIAQTVRPGGHVFVHEMSIANPLFRLYLSYVFPILKGIEEGTEYYLDPRAMDGVPGLRLATVRYFTFLPDFVPAALLPLLAPLERRLEASRLARYAAHFLVTYVRTDAAADETRRDPTAT